MDVGPYSRTMVKGHLLSWSNFHGAWWKPALTCKSTIVKPYIVEFESCWMQKNGGNMEGNGVCMAVEVGVRE